MGKRSDSDSDKKRKKRKHKHRRSEVLQSYATRRLRISNFDRPPQPYELMKILNGYENEQKPPVDQLGNRQSRRVCIGNLPESTSDINLRNKISKILVDYGGIVRPGDPVLTYLLLPEFRCMFVEFRTLEETEAALTLNGMEYENRSITIRRPADYYNSHVDTEVVVPRVNLNKIGLVSPFVDDDMTKILIGGLDLSFHEEHVKEILSAFGDLKALRLVKTQDELKSLGYAFCEFVNNAEAERACLALNGMELKGKTLVVRKVISSQYEQELVETSLGIFRGDGPDFSLITQYPGGCIQPNFDTIMYRNRPITVAELIRAKQTIEVLQHRAKEVAQDRARLEEKLFASGVGPPGVEYDHRSYEEVRGLGNIPYVSGNLFPSLNYMIQPEGSSNIICVEGIVDTDRFLVDTEFTKMYDEIMVEVSKYGTVISLIVPRISEGYFGKCIGKAYVEYIDASSAVRSSSLLGQKNWKGNPIKAYFFDSIKFMRNELD